MRKIFKNLQNMSTINYIAIIIALSLVLIKQSNSEERISHKPLSIMYCIAQQELQKGNWKYAIEKLEAINNQYPLSPYSQQIHLDLIYAYYKKDDLLSAQTIINRFIKLNPNHQNIDYVEYMQGIIEMQLDNNELQSFFRIDRSDRDPSHAHAAFSIFAKLVNKYPSSYYSSDAIKRLIFLKNRLAKYEYEIAKYYSNRGAWIAVINRIEDMLKKYRNTQIILNALKLMENAYYKIRMNEQANKVAKIIAINNNKFHA